MTAAARNRRGEERRSRRRASSERVAAPAPKPLELPKVSAVTAREGRRRLVVFVALTMFVFGLVMVASASSGMQMLNGLDQWAMFRKQLIFGIVGIISMWIAMRVPLEMVRRLARPLVYLCALLMVVVMIPGIGHSAKGASRWIDLGIFQLQPSEPLKLAVLFMVADHLSRSRPPEHWLRDLVKSPGGVALGFAGAVVGLQSDLGSGFVIGFTVLLLYMLAGTKWKVLWRTVGPVIALVALSILTESYRRDRFLAFLDPWSNPTEDGYQLVQALIAIGSGGAFGVGLGHSVQKIAFLPEAHTDMIFAIIIEELGFVGVFLVIGCFAVLAAVGARIAMRAKNRFSALLAAGLTAMIVGQAVTNIAGVTGVMPLTGVPLPLISYGGSSLIITLTALGLLANVATERRPARSFVLPPPEREEPAPVQYSEDDSRSESHRARSYGRAERFARSDDYDADSVEYDLDHEDDDDSSEHHSPDHAAPAGGRRGWRHRRASRSGAGDR